MSEVNRLAARSTELHHYEAWINSSNFEAELTDVLKGNPNFDTNVQPQPEQQPVSQEQKSDDNS